jgi:flagella basal body P-ring formation protein FlgA
MRRLFRFLVPIALAGSALAASVRADDRGLDVSTSADSVVRRAITARLGRPDAEIAIAMIDLPTKAPQAFRDAVPEPGSRLGRPMRFLLRPFTGRPVIAVVTATVIADRAVLRSDVARGAVLGADDVTLERGAIAGVILRRLPTLADLEGARARRTLAAGLAITPNDVLLRRAVEAGDKVTVVASSGAVEVSATLVAADGGDPGDLVRVVNPETRRDVRGRVTDRGRVEVEHGR